MSFFFRCFLAGTLAACGGSITADGGGPIDSGADTQLPLPNIDQIDLLLMVDNSASMGDKQELLAAVVPDIVSGLASLNGPNGAIRDIHIGVVTSSLGGGGATDVCDPNARISAQEAPNCTNVSRHNDDKGHLVGRTKPDCTMQGATEGMASNILAWQADQTKTNADFQSLVRGAQEFGCGLEAQLESWYRFLVQPDPWDSIQLDTNQSPAAAQLVGIDATILQQRHDFLRPTSIVGVIVLTDEDDSWSDPMWLGGRGWLTRAQNNTYSTTGQLPRGTTACAVDPNDPACQWCAFKGTETDPNCATNKGLYGPKEDSLNVRYTNDMKRRYGMDPQFPISRYVDGLKSNLVPDRTGEHFTADNKFSSTYVGRKNCRNPLYADGLPTDPNGELCKLKPGGRTPDMVFFTVIAGVPSTLVGSGQPTDAEWTKILGKDPATYQNDGIDPHMVESIKPRAGLPCQGGAPNTCDPINGKEWDTTTSKVGLDLQYACVFTLPAPKDCTKLPQGATCDCGGAYAGPLCAPNPADGNNMTLQVRGKAYPGIRELRVAKGMGAQGVIGSICTKSLDTNSPDFGYRAPVRTMIDRMRALLAR